MAIRLLKTTMRLHSLLLIMWCGCYLHAQDWTGPHHTLDTLYFKTENTAPHPETYRSMLGVTGGTNWDGLPSVNPVQHFIPNARSFHLMEIDFRYTGNPANYDVIPCLSDCDEFSCFPKVSGLPMAANEGSTLAYYKYRYCQKWYPQFAEVYASLETITPYYKNGYFDGQFVIRPYPNKWYTAEEWGGSAEAIEQNAYQYATSFAMTFCPQDTTKACLVNVLEIGNEPWGYPGPTAYHNIIRGVVHAFQDYYGYADPGKWRMQLSAAAFQADKPDSGLHDYVADMVPADMRPYLHYLSIHPYAFHREKRTLTEMPESADGDFLRIKNLGIWKEQHMPHAKVNVTEFGWNAYSNGPSFPGIGEGGQAAYTMRALLMMGRYQMHRAFIYELIDQPSVSLFNSTGLLQADGTPKKVYYTLENFAQKLGHLRFLKALREDVQKGMVYLLGNQRGEPEALVSWMPIEVNGNQKPAANHFYQIELPLELSYDVEHPIYHLDWDSQAEGTLSNNKYVSLNPDKSYQATIRNGGVPIVIPINSNGYYYNDFGKLVALEAWDANCGVGTVAILGNEVQCGAFLPTPIRLDSMLTPAEGDLYESVWQTRPSLDAGNWQTLTDTSLILQLPRIEKTGYFRMAIRKRGCANWHYSNIVEKRISPEQCPANDTLLMLCLPDTTIEIDLLHPEPARWHAPTLLGSCDQNDQFPWLSGQFELIGTYQGQSYLISKDSMTWDAASLVVQNMNGQLLEILDNAQQLWVADHLNQQSCWMGMTDLVTDQRFRWSVAGRPRYRNWSQEAISFVGDPDYGYFSSNGQWLLANEKVQLPFLMVIDTIIELEYDSPFVEQISGPTPNTILSPGVYEVQYQISGGCETPQICTRKIKIVPKEVPSSCDPIQDSHFQELGRWNDHVYAVFPKAHNWKQSREICMEHGGDLLVLDHPSEQEWIVNQLKEHGPSTVFIGLSDHQEDGQMRWVDGSLPGYFSWQSDDHALNGQVDHVYLGSWNNGPWLLAGEVVEKQALCEWGCEATGAMPRLVATPMPQFSGIKVFPSPFHARLNLQSLPDHIQLLQVFDSGGRVVYQSLPDHGTSTIEMVTENWPAGLYTLKIVDQMGNLFNQKVVKH